MLKKSKGQSVLEYVIILSVIIAAIVLFAQGALRPKVQNAMENAANEMERMTNRIHF